ncbi:hypothetical protein [Deinococcus petrolearius]|uniref:Photosystem II oxygen evolving complex protein PsbP n=1 Tax=Deinococcus petrolearius TaxID=1751295 RepID=A0ABW1DIN4_9DEIO
MKVLRSILPAALLFSSLAGAQTLVAFSDPKLPFRFSHPQGWLGVDLGDKTSGVSMVSAKAPPATMIRLLFVPKNGKAINVTQEFGGFEQGLKSTGVTLKTLTSKAASYGGVSGTEREYQLTRGKDALRMRVWFGNGAKNLYSFQLTDTAARYAAANALYSKVLATVRF